MLDGDGDECWGFRVQGAGFRVQGSGFRVQGDACWMVMCVGYDVCWGLGIEG